MDWKDKKVIILGAARQGTALAKFLLKREAEVIISDLRSSEELGDTISAFSDHEITWVLGEHPLSLLDQADFVCPSGGVPLSIPFIKEAIKRGIALSNDSQVFLQEAPCPVIGITGSAGKTTTTILVGRMCQAAAEKGEIRKAFVGGNIGDPLINYLDQMTEDDLAVMELSSFQLDLMTQSPQIAAILNIQPNHLDRHGTMDAYTIAKNNILRHQTISDILLLGRDDPNAWALREEIKGSLYSFGFSDLPEGQFGSYILEDQIFFRGENSEQAILPISEISLRGKHNQLNVMAACTLAAAAGLSPKAMQNGVVGFGGVAHRLEFVREWQGSLWYNDSKATGPQMTINAIQSFEEPIILLAGGRDKDLPWDQFAKLISKRVDHLVLFGEAASVIEKALQQEQSSRYTLDICKSLKKGVEAAAAHASSGDVVLLAPGGNSFDEFIDFEDRGDQFKQWVHSL